MKNNNAIIKGSLSDISKRNDASLAETFLNVEMIVLCDESGSMYNSDEVGIPRYERLNVKLKSLQESFQGKIAVIAFSDTPEFCPNGVPISSGGGTDLTKALEYIFVADDIGIALLVISDGEPDNEQTALRVASKFKTKIDTIYIGSERDNTGKNFLSKLAQATGGKAVTDFGLLGNKLEQTVTNLLTEKAGQKPIHL